jgi:hypothetical protein
MNENSVDFRQATSPRQPKHRPSQNPWNVPLAKQEDRSDATHSFSALLPALVRDSPMLRRDRVLHQPRKDVRGQEV